MAALILPVSLLLQAAIFAVKSPLRPGLAREAFLKAAVALGLIIAALAEMLSLGRGLSFGPMLGAWLGIVLIQGSMLAIKKGAERKTSLPALGQDQLLRLRTLESFDLWILAVVAVILLLCAIVALVCPPNNFDSMTYHMPRVMHWIQNRSIAHYPTNNLRQIAFPPGASFIVVSLQILSGGDRFANSVQWVALLGSVLGSSLIAARLRLDGKGQILAATLAATLPMAVMQAATTQTDLLTSFWLVCFAAFSLKEGDYAPVDLFWLAASLGLAILTKPTGLIFGGPLLLVVLSRLIRQTPESVVTENVVLRHVATTAAIFVLAGLLSLGQLWRNKTALGMFVPEDGRTLKAAVGLRQTASCAMKNLALELPFPPVWKAVLGIERHIFGLSPEDPGNNFSPRATRDLSSLCWRLILPDEDFVAGPVHFLLLAWALGVLGLALWREQEDPLSDRTCLMAGLLLGFLIFCAFFKWQEWANRLMLPLFMLAAPWTAEVLAPRLKTTGRKFLLVFLCATALLYGLTAIHRPLVALPAASILGMDREKVYLSGYAKTHETSFRAIIASITQNRCGYVGLDIGANDWEYAWWALMGLHSRASFMIKHINVGNASSVLRPEFPSEKLCAVVESEGPQILYFDSNDMAKMHAVSRHEPPRISQIRAEQK